MIFTVDHASHHFEEVKKEINSLEELLTFLKECGHDLILGYGYEDGNYRLTIYDHYIE